MRRLGSDESPTAASCSRGCRPGPMPSARGSTIAIAARQRQPPLSGQVNRLQFGRPESRSGFVGRGGQRKPVRPPGRGIDGRWRQQHRWSLRRGGQRQAPTSPPAHSPGAENWASACPSRLQRRIDLVFPHGREALPIGRPGDGVRQSLEQKVGLSRVRPSHTARLLWIVQRSQLALGDGIRQRERIPPQEVDVLVPQGGEAGEVLGHSLDAPAA